MSDDVNNRCDRKTERPTAERASDRGNAHSFVRGRTDDADGSVISGASERASERRARFTEQPQKLGPAANLMDTNGRISQKLALQLLYTSRHLVFSIYSPELAFKNRCILVILSG